MACTYMLSALLLSSCVESFSLSDFVNPAQKIPPKERALPKKSQTNVKTSSVKFAPSKKIVSEKLLDAEGHWYITENSQSYDPAKAHLQARNNVNIKRRKKKKNLSAHFKPDAKSGHDGTLRILRLEPKDRVDDKDPQEYEVAQSIITSPDSIIGKHSFDETKGHGYSNGVIIKPPSLPKRKRVYAFNDSNIKSDIITPKKKPFFGKKLQVGNYDEKTDVKGFPIPSIKPSIKNNGGAVLFEFLEKPSIVSKLRTGINSGKIRVVIEVSRVTKYKVAIDTIRNVLRIKMENTLWDMGRKGNIKGSSLLGTYLVKTQKDGSVLFEVRLKKKAKIVNTVVLRPNGKSAYRVVIDMKEI